MDRAYSILSIKSVDGEQRIIRGTATTPRPDRMRDIVEPLGVKFKNPMPLLHHHRSDQPVGTVRFDKPTADGITFEARLPTIAEPGPLRDRVETAWGEVKAGLIRAVSIGFRAIDDAVEFLESGGIRFLKTEVLELSLVAVPANADATIQLVKSLDAEQLAASGRSVAKAPAASGVSVKHVTRKGNAVTKHKSYADRIAAFESTLEAKTAEMDSIMDEADEEGRTLNAEEKESYDGLQGECAELREHIKRLKVRQADAASRATPVEDVKDVESGSTVRGGGIPAQAKAPKPAPGIRLARFARCLGMATKSHRDVMSVAEEQYGQRDPDVVGMIKAAVIASNTTTDAALIGNVGGWADFVEFLRPMTILGQFGTNGRPAVRRVPFRVPLITQSGAGTGYWVGEGKAKPVTKPAFTRTTLDPLKVANIAVATMEQIRDSSPSAEMLIRDDLAAALVVRMDTSFIDPNNSGDPGIRPASITDSIVPIPSSGGTAAGVREDVRAAMAAFVAANNPLTSGVWIMSAGTALGLQLMVNELTSTPEFPGVTVNGGQFFGLPVITSEHVGDYVVLVNAGDIYFADEGGITIDMSTEASLEMDNDPDGDSVAASPVHAELVSLWQTNSVGFRAERTVNWMRRRASGVAVIGDVAWGVPAES